MSRFSFFFSLSSSFLYFMFVFSFHFLLCLSFCMWNLRGFSHVGSHNKCGFLRRGDTGFFKFHVFVLLFSLSFKLGVMGKVSSLWFSYEASRMILLPASSHNYCGFLRRGDTKVIYSCMFLISLISCELFFSFSFFFFLFVSLFVWA